jgi:hypothetical protein
MARAPLTEAMLKTNYTNLIEQKQTQKEKILIT